MNCHRIEKGTLRVQISSPSDVPGSGEGSMPESEDVEVERSYSAPRRSLWLDLRSSRRGLGLTTKVVYLMILSRIISSDEVKIII
jgi:hypothetical protein